MSDSISTQIVSYVALAIAIGGMIVSACNHKALKSRCCGREASVSLDIDSTSPRGAATQPLTADPHAEPSRPIV